MLEGLHYRQVDESERLVELALNLRYTLNAKTIKVSKLSKDRLKAKIKQAFQTQSGHKGSTASSFVEKIQRLNAHFQNK
ncbi:hypothetical protein FRX57_02765 [Streptococcus cuniculipharyngis]|uniref:Uncharacterized protein n=1 Tax=Streptococcus cuniculipharyngis TaxID=1562651 RepID=A0A5C5SGP0_9STRE|nr:hypothetical protein FRX57_02765 [Streptococcus cuniculipharyngis]